MARDGWNESMTIFEHGTITDNNGFRIPAITTTSQGTVVAVADIRYGGLTGNTDMPKKVEFLIKTSNDGGSTWSEGTILAPAGGITDPSIVHDSNTGKTFLFTGTLQNFTRNEIKEEIEKLGGKNLSAVSKNLDYLIVGEKAGSKLKKAQELGTVKIITEEEFMKICGKKS